MPPIEWSIFVETIGTSFILMLFIRINSSQCVLYLLKGYSMDLFFDIFAASYIELDDHRSVNEIPEWIESQ